MIIVMDANLQNFNESIKARRESIRYYEADDMVFATKRSIRGVLDVELNIMKEAVYNKEYDDDFFMSLIPILNEYSLDINFRHCNFFEMLKDFEKFK